MDSKKLKKLEKMGGRVTTVKEFLGLTDADELIVEIRLRLAAAMRERRLAAGFTQDALAKAIGSSQSRIAKMEGGDPQASIESLLSAVVAVGGRPRLVVAKVSSKRGHVVDAPGKRSKRAVARKSA